MSDQGDGPLEEDYEVCDRCGIEVPLGVLYCGHCSRVYDEERARDCRRWLEERQADPAYDGKYLAYLLETYGPSS